MKRRSVYGATRVLLILENSYNFRACFTVQGLEILGKLDCRADRSSKFSGISVPSYQLTRRHISEHLNTIPRLSKKYSNDLFYEIYFYKWPTRSQWSRGLRHRSAVARLQRLWVRIPREVWITVCFECCVLSGRSLCDGPTTRLEDSFRLWCVVVCDL
jgi:hypothetical protein